MAEYKDGEILPKETSTTIDPYIPTEAEVKVINRVYERFSDMKDERDKERHEFDDRTITEYVNYNLDAYNGIVSEEIKSTKEDWQSLIWDHETRGKVKTIVSKITGAKPYMSLIGQSEADHAYARDMDAVYEDSWKDENGSYKLYLQALSCAIKGTVIVEETYVEEKYKCKEITDVDIETGKVKFTEKTKIRGGAGRVESRIVPLLSFYPNENSPEIKHDCATLQRYSKKKFMEKFGKYPNAEHVNNGVWADTFSGVEYKSQSTKEDELVEIIRYYNEDHDEFVILANGVWLNKQDGEKVSPLPFDHKKLPFAKTVFELADEDCFYGKAMPDLLGGEQETRNALLRLMVDQEILSVNKPILLGLGIEIESYQLYPGKAIKATGDIGQIKEMEISGANQSGFQLLQMLRNSSDVNTSIDPTAQGVHQGRKTAREAIILDQNAERITSTFRVFIYKLLFERASLRIENIKQFYTSPVQYSVLRGKKGIPLKDSMGRNKMKPEYRSVTVENPGQEPEWMTVDPSMKGANFRIRFIEDYEISMDKATRLELSKAILDEAKANPLMDADEATIDYIEATGKNPERYYIPPSQDEKDFNAGVGVPPENPPANQEEQAIV